MGWHSTRPSSKPSAAAAITPDPCRGWGRHLLAHIRAQREPVVSPAGTGAEYRRPDGSPGASQAGAAKRQETHRNGRKITDEGSVRDTLRREMAFSSCRHGKTRTPLQKETRAGDARRARGTFAAPPGDYGCAAAGDCQEAFEVARRLRGAAFFPVEDSTCKVPLQSG